MSVARKAIVLLLLVVALLQAQQYLYKDGIGPRVTDTRVWMKGKKAELAKTEAIISEALVLRLTLPAGENIWAWDDTKTCTQPKVRCAVEDLVSAAAKRQTRTPNPNPDPTKNGTRPIADFPQNRRTADAEPLLLTRISKRFRSTG